MTMKTLSSRAAVLAVVVAVSLAACSSEAPAGPPEFDGSHVSADAFAAAVEAEGVTVIDVRSPEEFAEGHLPGAVNVDVQAPSFPAEIAELDPSARYAVYCRSGNRSRVAIDLMTQAGVTQTVGLEGGVGAWTGALDS